MRGRSLAVCVLAFAVLVYANTAAAEKKNDSFWVQIGEPQGGGGGGGVFIAGGGSGYENGTWYWYENTEWWNTWFYDDPPDPHRWKEISYTFLVRPLDPAQDSYADITINWTTMDYPETGSVGPPPLPPLDPLKEEQWIVRADPGIYQGFVPVDGENVTGDFIIPDYNPEWISIDVWGYNFEIVNGDIIHECVPEPATLCLLALGGLAIVRRRR